MKIWKWVKNRRLALERGLFLMAHAVAFGSLFFLALSMPHNAYSVWLFMIGLALLVIWRWEILSASICSEINRHKDQERELLLKLREDIVRSSSVSEQVLAESLEITARLAAINNRYNLK